MIIPSQHASRVARTAAGGGGGGSAFTAGEFNFNDQYGLSANQGYTTNIVTMPHGGTLAVYCNNVTDGGGNIYKNGVAQTAYTTSAMTTSGFYAYSAQYAQFAVVTGDQVYFDYLGFFMGSVYLTVEVRNATFSGTLIDTHVVQFTGECLLTTAVVAHMGGLDSGPELTAMRMLREHYRSTQGYAEEIQDYYTYSPLIVNAINNSADKEAVYLEIYATVKSCESFVMASQWEQAHDLYMTMYLSLKNKYIR